MAGMTLAIHKTKEEDSDENDVDWSALELEVGLVIVLATNEATSIIDIDSYSNKYV
jgi:hypothetical protein